jgi:membrane fusion protein, multidrug efflux system
VNLRRRIKKVFWGILQGLSISLMLLVAACKEEKSSAPTTAEPKVVLATATVETIPLFLELTGRTEAPNTVSIRSRVDGHVESRQFTEGADIGKGDILFVIDQRPYKSELSRLEGEHEKNLISFEFDTRESKRISILATDGAIAKEKLDQAETNAAVAKGTLDSSLGAVEAAQVTLDYATVTAPIDGRIGRVYQDIGNVVSANDTVLVELAQMDPLYVYISPSEAQFLELESYLATNPNLKVAISLIDGSTHAHSGSLDFSNPSVDPTTGTVAVRAVFPNPELTLRPGQYARVQIKLTEQQGNVTVPAEGIGQDQAGFYVFVVGKDNKAELRRVTVGRIYKGRRIVMTGLKDGEAVIVKGQQRVRSGITVRIAKPSADSTADKADG